MNCDNGKDLFIVIRNLHKTCKTLWNSVDYLTKLLLRSEKKGTGKKMNLNPRNKIWKKKVFGKNFQEDKKKDQDEGKSLEEKFRMLVDDSHHEKLQVTGVVENSLHLKVKEDQDKKKEMKTVFEPVVKSKGNSKKFVKPKSSPERDRKGDLFRCLDRLLAKFPRDSKKIILEHENGRLGCKIGTFHGMKNQLVDKYLGFYEGNDLNPLEERLNLEFKKIVETAKVKKEHEMKLKKAQKRVRKK